MAVLTENPTSASSTALLLTSQSRPLPPTPVTEESQNETKIVHRIQDGLVRLRNKCQTTWKTWTSQDVDEEDQEKLQSLILNIEENETAAQEVQFRPTKEWAKRLSDYQYLSGQDKELPKRQTRSSVRARRQSALAKGYRCSKCEMVVHRNCLNGVQRCETRVRRESPILPSPPPILRRPSDPYPGYGSLQLLNFPWWVEKMTRTDAHNLLELQPDGTFLIRWSDRHQKLVLSLKVSNDVKHMRVLRHEEASSFYLSEARYFRTVELLVNYYRQNSLSECFADLFETLSRPLYNTAVAKYPFEGLGSNNLSLRVGDRVIIISTNGENNGWWKGRIEDRMGYFPMEYVQVENSFHR